MTRKFQYDIFHLKTEISTSWATNRIKNVYLDISINKMFTHLGINTVELRSSDVLHNEILRMTNDFLYPSNSKRYEKEP